MQYERQHSEQKRYTNSGTLLVVTGIVFMLLAALLVVLDFVPEPYAADARPAPTSSTAAPDARAEKGQEVAVAPIRIRIDAIGVDAPIVNPVRRDVEILDQALTQGVVHYPGSGTLADESNLFLFGHSSALPVVHNQNFKVFNDLKKLEPGNTIRVATQTHEHVYRVRGVRLTTAQEALVRFETGQKQLTLSTCNSFGEKSQRWVVEADFIGSYQLTR